MAHVVLYHSALGLRPGVRWFADRLAEHGHTVETPDYYDGEVFDTLDAGLSKRDSIGYAESLRRAGAVAVDEPAVVYAGFSLGCRLAQWSEQTRDNAIGCVLLHDAQPVGRFGPWPERLPVEIHAMCDDPWFERENALSIVDSAHDSSLNLYRGDAHLFADPDLPSHDPAATALVLDRVRVFLDRLPLH